MKIQRFFALLLVVIMTLGCFAACRTENEKAFSITYEGQKVDISTALYMCFLVNADQTFQSEAVAEAQKNNTKYSDYKELRYENKDYETWTKDEAKKSAQEYAFYEVQFKRFGLSFTNDEEASLDSETEQIWKGSASNDGISEVYEANGISYNTFKDFYINMRYKHSLVYNFYIEEDHEGHNHGEEDHSETTTTAKKLDEKVEKLRGSLRPSDDKIDKALETNYVPVYAIEMSFTDDNNQQIDDKTKKQYKKTLDNYKKELDKGTSFEKIYKEYQEHFSAGNDSQSSSYERMIMSASAKKASEGTEEADENFNEVYKMKVNEVKVLENSNSYILVVRQDMLRGKDTNKTAYKDTYLGYGINILVQDKYDSDIVDKAIKSMKTQANDSAINAYSPDKIDYLNDTTTAATSSVN